MAPVRAVWGYPHTMSKALAKGNNITITSDSSYTGSDRNKVSDRNNDSEETLPASAALINGTADGNCDGSDTIRPIELNDFRKYASVHAV